MSTANKNAPRQLERFRVKHSYKTVAERPGKGAEAKRESVVLNLSAVLKLKKKDGKAAKDLRKLDAAGLRAQLVEARKAYFTLRCDNVVAPLENVAALSQARRRIARILTLIKQKEVGA